MPAPRHFPIPRKRIAARRRRIATGTSRHIGAVACLNDTESTGARNAILNPKRDSVTGYDLHARRPLDPTCLGFK